MEVSRSGGGSFSQGQERETSEGRIKERQKKQTMWLLWRGKGGSLNPPPASELVLQLHGLADGFLVSVS